MRTLMPVVGLVFGLIAVAYGVLLWLNTGGFGDKMAGFSNNIMRSLIGTEMPNTRGRRRFNAACAILGGGFLVVGSCFLLALPWR
ncbi:hypothetical protein ABH935_005712 [Catenulispora sp. GAS73]|uniref:hypothetical protein n=1 Tax=Catenulispora sp. GAS73 TaxID=3156269 RepID=UPI003514C7F1